MVIVTVESLRGTRHKDRGNLSTKVVQCIKAVGSMAWSKDKD